MLRHWCNAADEASSPSAEEHTTNNTTIKAAAANATSNTGVLSCNPPASPVQASDAALGKPDLGRISAARAVPPRLSRFGQDSHAAANSVVQESRTSTDIASEQQPINGQRDESVAQSPPSSQSAAQPGLKLSTLGGRGLGR